MGNERLSVWEKQLEKPLIYRTVQTFFPFVHHEHDLPAQNLSQTDFYWSISS